MSQSTPEDEKMEHSTGRDLPFVPTTAQTAREETHSWPSCAESSDVPDTVTNEAEIKVLKKIDGMAQCVVEAAKTMNNAPTGGKTSGALLRDTETAAATKTYEAVTHFNSRRLEQPKEPKTDGVNLSKVYRVPTVLVSRDEDLETEPFRTAWEAFVKRVTHAPIVFFVGIDTEWEGKNPPSLIQIADTEICFLFRLAPPKPPANTAQTPVGAAKAPIPPTGAVKTPLDAAQTPLDAAKTPLDAAKTPLDAAQTPLDAAKTPLESTTHPSSQPPAQHGASSSNQRVRISVERLQPLLKPLLTAQHVFLCGVEVREDCTKLQKMGFGPILSPLLELKNLVVRLKLEGGPSLVNITRAATGLDWRKDKNVTVSKWEVSELSRQQLQYAADDAVAAVAAIAAVISTVAPQKHDQGLLAWAKTVSMEPPPFKPLSRKPGVHASPAPSSAPRPPLPGDPIPLKEFKLSYKVQFFTAKGEQILTCDATTAKWIQNIGQLATITWNKKDEGVMTLQAANPVAIACAICHTTGPRVCCSKFAVVPSHFRRHLATRFRQAHQLDYVLVCSRCLPGVKLTYDAECKRLWEEALTQLKDRSARLPYADGTQLYLFCGELASPEGLEKIPEARRRELKDFVQRTFPRSLIPNMAGGPAIAQENSTIDAVVEYVMSYELQDWTRSTEAIDVASHWRNIAQSKKSLASRTAGDVDVEWSINLVVHWLRFFAALMLSPP